MSEVDVETLLKRAYIFCIDHSHIILPVVHSYLEERGKIIRAWYKQLNKKFLLAVIALGLLGFPVNTHNVSFLIHDVLRWPRHRVTTNIAIKLAMYCSYGVLVYAKAYKKMKIYYLNPELRKQILGVLGSRALKILHVR